MFNNYYDTIAPGASAREVALSNTLPNLLVIGAPKAGTTSLFSYLGQHPDICPSQTKEIGYFSALRRGQPLPSAIETYGREFARWNGERYRLEATPSYCYSGERLIAGVRSILDRPKIILSLREPVERLWSAYTFQRSKGNLGKVRSFEDYVRLSRERHRQGPAWRGGSHFSGLSIGFYGDYLEPWLAAFGDDMRVIFTDDLFRDPLRVLSEFCDWLAIDAQVLSSLDFGARLKTTHVRNTRVARWVYGTKKAADGLLRKHPELRAGLKNAYLKLNAGKLEETLKQSTRNSLEDLYRDSNRRAAAVLTAYGYRQLPGWLQNG